MTLAEIATADGKILRPETLECKRFGDRKSPPFWPNQAEPIK